ncbi:porin family protein [Vibrio sp. SCSIO 43136]|uniref:porin family protein n=1 Tax=Vibrio sp. SCSIO 43136 TaxID=2819101 RepID=UPI002074D2C1|nr:porin family protein [Vibrio sp. SCSIO 43136]USD68046.1 porin family protein [Vibrio sp. SCSIO 43136]
MNNHFTIFTVTMALLLSAAPAYSAGHSSIKLLLGKKNLNDDWGRDDSMDTIGFLSTIQPASLPVGIAIDLYGSGHEHKDAGRNALTSVAEMNIGLRWQSAVIADSLIPYFGGGLSLVYSELQAFDAGIKNTYDDTGTGYWIGGGIDYLYAEHWSFGLEARYSHVDVKLNDDKRNAGGFNWGASVGYHF